MRLPVSPGRAQLDAMRRRRGTLVPENIRVLVATHGDGSVGVVARTRRCFSRDRFVHVTPAPVLLGRPAATPNRVLFLRLASPGRCLLQCGGWDGEIRQLHGATRVWAQLPSSRLRDRGHAAGNEWNEAGPRSLSKMEKNACTQREGGRVLQDERLDPDGQLEDELAEGERIEEQKVQPREG
ncbi:hypothetical protein H4582DRAFT_2131659 [Lactarius indigo]|nr:hypothetical protein H4582DRAFT_2131659 [Lactarius indigo]